MLLVINAVSVSMLYNAHRMGLEQFGSEVSADFSGFFGASPEEYMQYHLSTADPGVESYPDAASSLVSESGYCIRYILYETADTITAAECSDNGYSRYRVLSGQEASGLKAGMLVYTRDVSLRSRSAGKVSFLIDLTPFLDTFFHEKSDGAVYYFTGDRVSMELQSQIGHWLENR